ncbi:MAG: SagB/ThcOx family dehydrogenase [Tannerellaceae bacterium]|jgi:SagB-type dehydrogenase family enzyme|nr:SagB/ThcOx family dehydrogenase [Tannerellaceae bacterium]
MKTKIISEEIGRLDVSLYGPKNFKESLALLFNENTKFDDFLIRKQIAGIQGFSNPYILDRASQPYKAYPTCKKYSINQYINIQPQQKNIFDVIKNRRSGRAYTDYSISLNELSAVLHYSYGIMTQSPISDSNNTWKFRAVPSAGGLYPLEFYLYINNSVLPKGFYHYRPDQMEIELIHEEDLLQELKKILVAEPYVDISNSSCILFITSVFERILIKYGDRGYRFILQEVGLVTQNISLVCEAIGLSSCILGSYVDEKVNEYLKADGTFESIQNIIVIGKNKAHESNSSN